MSTHRTPPAPRTRSPFQRELAANIARAIQAAKAEGVTSASLDNLKAITKSPLRYLDGSPTGTNAQWLYHELFKETAQTIPAARAFILA